MLGPWSCFITHSSRSTSNRASFLSLRNSWKNVQIIFGSRFRTYIYFSTDNTGSKSTMSPVTFKIYFTNSTYTWKPTLFLPYSCVDSPWNTKLSLLGRYSHKIWQKHYWGQYRGSFPLRFDLRKTMHITTMQNIILLRTLLVFSPQKMQKCTRNF